MLISVFENSVNKKKKKKIQLTYIFPIYSAKKSRI